MQLLLLWIKEHSRIYCACCCDAWRRMPNCVQVWHKWWKSWNSSKTQLPTLQQELSSASKHLQDCKIVIPQFILTKVSSATKHLHNCKIILPQFITNLQVQKASIGKTAETSHNSSLTFEFSKQAFAQLQNHPTIRHWPCKGRKETWWWCKQVKLVQMHKLQDDTLEQSSSTTKTS